MIIAIIIIIIIVFLIISSLHLKLIILIISIQIKLTILLMILILLLHVKNLIKNNINNNNNKNNNNNRVNFTSPSPSQNSKETVFILGYSMVKKLKGFLLTRKLNHKWVVKARPFSSAKVRCMHDHIKPTVTDFNLNHIILHCRTNDPSSERTASQIARSITELTLSLKISG